MRPRFLHAGYLTPPGNGEYWAECWYPLFVAYVCCNGFALVFSVAAIVAVLVGPIILVCLDRPNWRVQIAVLAIIHLAFSLASFLAAFALAGFITASVNAPALNCGNLKCEEGGVPCSAYTLRSSEAIYARYNETSSKVEEVGTYNQSWYTLPHSEVFSRRLFELVLDPVIAQLNNDTFGDARTWETPGKDVVCRDYNYLALSSFPDGHSLFNRLNDINGKAIDRTCLVLLEHTLVSDLHYSYLAQGSARWGWKFLKPNAHTLWCSTNTTNLGPGWLPLTMQTGLSLLHNCIPEAYDDAQYDNVTVLPAQQAASMYAIDEGGGRQGCPNLQFSKSASTPVAGLWPRLNVSALQLLSDNDNAWNGNGDAKYKFGPGDHAFCNLQMQTKRKFARVLAYAGSLGWDRSGVLFRPSRNGEYVDPALCQNMPHNSSVSDNHPLRSAKLYASLRFQCSGLEKGVLCDFGVDPPLAVSPDGRYLSKRNMPDLPDVVVFGSPQTATSVELAVIGMVIAVLVSNLISITFLACWPRLMRCATKLRERFAIARDASFGAPQGAVSSA